MPYETNTSLSTVAGLIRSAGRILVTTHAKPDGDAYGAVAAMTAAIRRLLPRATVEGVLMGPVLPCFKLLRGYPLVSEFNAAKPTADADLIIVLDTGAWSQVAPMRPIIEPRLDRTLIIDHHLTGDIAAKHLLVDSKAAACCGVLAQVLDALAGVSPAQAAAAVAGAAGEPNELLKDPIVAESLFAGIASDTGWFRFSNTNVATHLLAARLINCGLDQADLYARLEQADRPQKLALQVRALSSIRFLADGAAALMTLRRTDFAATGALTEETERFVDLPQTVESVKMVVLVTEPPEEVRGGRGGKTPIRLSVRSKPGPDAINVADFAAQFGGGGHARAAGAKVDAAFEDVVRRVELAVEKLFHRGG